MERICVFEQNFGHKSSVGQVWSQEPSAILGISIPSWLDHRRKIGDVAETSCCCRHGAHNRRIHRASPIPFCQDLLFAPTLTIPAQPQQWEHQCFSRSISYHPPLSPPVPAKSPRPSTNPGLCLGSSLSLGPTPLPSFDNFPLPTSPTCQGWVTASLPPPERMSLFGTLNCLFQRTYHTHSNRQFTISCTIRLNSLGPRIVIYIPLHSLAPTQVLSAEPSLE